jgi:Zn-dependent protease
MPIILLIATNGKFAFGGAKPVRINPLNFRNPSFDMMVTAAAGPACNLGLVVAGILLLCMLTSVSPELVQPGSYNAIFFGYLILINLMLGIFNLIPIPPLDGSRILRHFLTSSGRNFMDSIEPFGLLILMVVIFVTRIIDFIIVVFTNIVNYVLFVILGPGYNIFNLLGFT